MLSQHKFYVYYDGPKVFARRGQEPAVVAEEFATAQQAHDKVQTIVNPEGKHAIDFGRQGFHAAAFQDAISGNCEAYVKAAYARVDQ